MIMTFTHFFLVSPIHTSYRDLNRCLIIYAYSLASRHNATYREHSQQIVTKCNYFPFFPFHLVIRCRDLSRPNGGAINAYVKVSSFVFGFSFIFVFPA